MTNEQYTKFKATYLSELAEVHNNVLTRLTPAQAAAFYKMAIERLAQSNNEAVLGELVTALSEATAFFVQSGSEGTTQIIRMS
jgi:DNA-binding MurR/RpiR family transcriptional regulator